MRALIIEDESAAAQNLRTILNTIEPSIEVVELCESVVESVEFLERSADSIDLIFMDIHLADGDAFKIFERVEVTTPIIFTTAYDQYAIKAFKVNSIDYLLKPINSDELREALSKLRRLSAAEATVRNESLRSVARSGSKALTTLLIHFKDKIVPLKTNDIAYIYTSDERTHAKSLSGEIYPLDKSLDAIYSTLDTEQFYRANRQFVVARHAIQDASVWFGNRLSLNLICDTPEKIIIPKARISEFKSWLSEAIF